MTIPITKQNNTIKYFICINSITTINMIKLKDTIVAYSINYDKNYCKNYLNFIESLKRNNIEFSSNGARKCYTKVYKVLFEDENMILRNVCTIKNGIFEKNK